MKKSLLTAVLFCASFMANAQCTAVETLNESFENFVDGGFAQNCWTTNEAANSPKATITTVAGSKVVQLYSFFTPAVPWYIVSPEVSTIDGNHKLSFSVSPIAGTMTVQVGTMATPTDFANFQNVGNPIAVSAAQTNFSNIIIPASATQKHIAFKVVATAMHVASALDNIVWESTLGVNDSKLASLSVYPNPSVDRNVTISYNNDVVSSEKNSVAVYNLAGAKVFETIMQENTQTLNLSELASGIYILKLQSGSNVATKKLVLK